MIQKPSRPRRILCFVSFIIAACFVAVLICSYNAAEQNAPRYVPGQPVDAITNLSIRAMYDDDMPIQSGRAWVWMWLSQTNHHEYWVDMDNRTIAGELFNASAIFCDKDLKKILCYGHGGMFSEMKNWFGEWVRDTFRLKIAALLRRDEAFWILDLESNRAKRVGRFGQFTASGSRWYPSPGFRFGYNQPTTSSGEFYLADLELEQMTSVRVDGKFQTWWDERSLLMKDPGNNLFLYDVLSQKTNLLFSAVQIQSVLKDSNLPEALDFLHSVTWWARNNTGVFLTSTTNWPREDSYLLKLATNHLSPTLEVFDRDFHFEWLGNLNPDATLYLYPGESGPPGDGGDGSVHFRDLRTGEQRTLVASNQSKQYTCPRFYKNRVIYKKNNQIWSVGLDGNDNTNLFSISNRSTANP